MTFVKVVNKVLEKTMRTKGVRHASGQGMHDLWISLAHYDDRLMEELKNWERWRDEQGHLDKRHRGGGTYEGKNVAQIFQDGRWDKIGRAHV